MENLHACSFEVTENPCSNTIAPSVYLTLHKYMFQTKRIYQTDASCFDKVQTLMAHEIYTLFTNGSNRVFTPTFTHRADGRPGLVWPAGNGAAVFHLLTFRTGDTDWLTNMKRPLGSVPATAISPAWRSRARLRCEGWKLCITFWLAHVFIHLTLHIS